MFDSLQDRMDRAFKTLKGQGKITELNVAATVKEIRRALVEADVNYKIAKEFTETVRQEALGQNVLTAVSPGQLMVKIVKDELAQLMGGETAEFNLKGKPAVVLLSGLQGSGKTTFCGKLARRLKSKTGTKILMVACDVYRPAAIDQLKVLGEQIKVDVYSELDNSDAVAIATNGVEHAKKHNYNIVIVDTAGRLAIDEEMMTEITNIKQAIQPDETLFVVDSMTGQDAVNTAKTFNERLDFDGVVLSKLDGDSRGGAALSIRYVVKKPIKFISTGEHLDKIDVFHPDRMAQRILGMGDIISFVERAQQQYDEQEAEKLQKKINKNQFDFNDFLSQLNQIRKMGNFKELLAMIPGLNKALKDIEIGDKDFKRVEAIIFSMTPHERANPQVLDKSRKTRIAKGCGMTLDEIDRFVSEFERMKKMMKNMSGMGGMMGGGGQGGRLGGFRNRFTFKKK